MRYRLVLTLKLGQTDNILWVWCRAGAIEMHQSGVGELVRAPFLRRQVRVALRHLDGRVPHPDLHLAKVVSGRHAVRRERVAQHVPPLASGEGADLFRRDGERTAAALGLLLAARPTDEGADRGQLLVLEVGGAVLVVQYELADLCLVPVVEVAPIEQAKPPVQVPRPHRLRHRAFAVLKIVERIMHGLHWSEAVLSYIVAGSGPLLGRTDDAGIPYRARP